MSRIKLSEHFHYGRLFRFVLPSIIMMVFVSVYGIVDGFFVSNYVGAIPFAALNLIYPMVMILGSVGFMLGTGGNAVVAQALGEGDKQKANRVFSMLVYTTVLLGVALAAIGIAVVRPVAKLFATSETEMSAAEKAELIEYCVSYARVVLLALPAFMLQNAFQGFFVTAEKPRLGLYVTMAAGCGNILFDALFVAVFHWGLVGAAAATALSQCIGGVLPLFYFGRKNDSLLKLGRTRFDGRTLGKVCINGMSELMTNISLSLIAILYNAQLMKLVGYTGVSAYGIIQYIGFIFVAVFLGYSIGVAPIVGYHYGAGNDAELKNVFKKSILITLVFGMGMTLLSFLGARVFASIFTDGDRALLDLTTRGMRINAFSFLVCGFNIFGSAFFTALGCGGVSLLISFSRTLVFQALCVIVMPLIFGLDGVWSAVVAAESISLVLTLSMFVLRKRKYHYL